MFEQSAGVPPLADLCGHTATECLPGRSFAPLMRNLTGRWKLNYPSWDRCELFELAEALAAPRKS